MAQRYTDPTALERLAAGLCPECGGKADQHAPFREFWLRPPGCDLRPDGVLDRIAQWNADRPTLTWMRPRTGTQRRHAIVLADGQSAYEMPAPPALCGLSPRTGWAAGHGEADCPKCLATTSQKG